MAKDATVIEQMREGMLLLDSQKRIVDLNPAAEKILGVSVSRVRGRSALEVLPASLDLNAVLQAAGALRREITIGTGDASRQYALNVSPFDHKGGFPLGFLIQFHDVTEQNRGLARMLEQERALATLHERDRVARELHDSLGQVLGYVKMQAQAARDLLARNQVSQADRHLAHLVEITQNAHADVREYVLGARVGLPADFAFLAALERYLLEFTEHYGIATKLSVPPELTNRTFEPMVATQLLRIIQEALSNVRKHAGAHRVNVSLLLSGGHAEAVVDDDGAGFDPALPGGEGRQFGLRSMRERAEEVGGSVRIHSAPGAGTQVVISVPVQKAIYESAAGR